MDGYSSITKRLNVPIVTLFFIILIDAIGMGLIIPIFTPIFIDNSIHLFNSHFSLGDRELLLSAVFAIYPLAMFIGAPLLGAISDKYGRKKTLVWTLFGNTGGYLVSALGILFPSLSLLLLGRLISGTTSGSFPIAQASIVDLSSAATKPKRLALISIANGIGCAIGPILGGVFTYLAHRSIFSDADPFIIMMIFTLLSLVMILTSLSETHTKYTTEKINPFTGLKNVYTAFKTPKIRILSIIFFLYMLSYLNFMQYAPVYLNILYKFTGRDIGYFMSYFAIWFALSLILLLPLVLKILSAKSIMRWSLALQPPLILLFFTIKSALSPWVIITLLACCYAFSYIAIITLMSNVESKAHQGRIMGIAASLMALGWGLGAITSSADYLFVLLPFIASIVIAIISTALTFL